MEPIGSQRQAKIPINDLIAKYSGHIPQEPLKFGSLKRKSAVLLSTDKLKELVAQDEPVQLANQKTLRAQIFPKWLQKRKDFCSMFQPSVQPMKACGPILILRKEPAERSAADVQTMAQWLREFNCLSRMSLQQLMQLCGAAKLLKHRNSETVFSQGDIGDAFYVIASGGVDVIINGHTVDTLKIGAGFGELALISRKPRRAAIICNQPSELLVVKAEDYKRILRTSQISAVYKMSTIVGRKISYFAKWSKGRLKHMISISTRLSHKKGTIIFSKGETAEDVIWSLSGRFAVLTTVEYTGSNSWPTEKGRRRRKKDVLVPLTVSVLGEGRVLSAESLMPGASKPERWFTLKALTDDCETLSLSSTEANSLIKGPCLHVIRKEFANLAGSVDKLLEETEFAAAFDHHCEALRSSCLGPKYRERVENGEKRLSRIATAAGALPPSSPSKKSLTHSQSTPLLISPPLESGTAPHQFNDRRRLHAAQAKSLGLQLEKMKRKTNLKVPIPAQNVMTLKNRDPNTQSSPLFQVASGSIDTFDDMGPDPYLNSPTPENPDSTFVPSSSVHSPPGVKLPALSRNSINLNMTRSSFAR
eukprot:TRINITY_DN3615_c0_g1_i1.p1 TRINITY_DN3615_c0_g1~~TRINITY_DN3615_c0_g1_i1.p1  ORF type:complete len:589 (+),score=132.14 TRINITY_DN3615_c0_g1_i1:137-1903(+)